MSVWIHFFIPLLVTSVGSLADSISLLHSLITQPCIRFLEPKYEKELAEITVAKWIIPRPKQSAHDRNVTETDDDSNLCAMSKQRIARSSDRRTVISIVLFRSVIAFDTNSIKC
jgi:hypothetical protein